MFTNWEKHLKTKQPEKHTHGEEEDSNEDTILKGIFSFSGPGGIQGGPEANMARYKATIATGKMLGKLWKKNTK